VAGAQQGFKGLTERSTEATSLPLVAANRIHLGTNLVWSTKWPFKPVIFPLPDPENGLNPASSLMNEDQ
jgi:hypothetical protein